MRFHAGRAGSALAAMVATAALGGTGVAGAEKASPLDVEGFDFGFSGVPSTMEEGRYKLSLENTGAEPHVIVFLRLNEPGAALSDEQLLAAADAEDDSVIAEFGGDVFAKPGATKTRKAEFSPGSWAYFCFVGNENGPHYRQGMWGRTTVTAAD